MARGVQWSDAELRDALTLTEAEFLARYPERNARGLRQRLEPILGGETYGQFRARQARQRATVSPATLAVKPAPSDDQYETFFRLLESADALKDDLCPTQERTEFTAPDDGLPIAIAFTGDWHCGAGGVRYDLLRRDLDLIRATDGCYAIGMGDWLEGVSVVVKAASALYSGLFNDGGYQEVYVKLRAEALIGKWLAVLSGNHDEWIHRTAGISRMDQFAAHLGAPHFGQGGGTIYVNVGSQRYAIGVRHNTAGNSRLNTTNPQRRAFDDWPAWESLHVICIAHLHFNDLHVATRKNGRCVYLRSATYKTRDAHAKDHGFTPEWGVPVAILLPDEQRVIAFRGDDFLHAIDYFVWLRGEYAAGRRSPAAADDPAAA